MASELGVGNPRTVHSIPIITMIPFLTCGSVNLENLVEQILLTRHITLSDRRDLMCAFLQNTMTEAELVLVDRLFYGLRKGLLELTD